MEQTTAGSKGGLPKKGGNKLLLRIVTYTPLYGNHVPVCLDGEDNFPTNKFHFPFEAGKLHSPIEGHMNPTHHGERQEATKEGE